MAKIIREKVKVFAGGSQTASEFGVVGSFAKGNPVVATQPQPPAAQVIETLSSYDDGLTSIVEDGHQLPTMEEINTIFFLFTKWLKYGFQEGVIEYSPTETYYPRSVVKYNGYLYQAINSNANGFSGIAPPNAGYWGRLYLAPNSVDTETINDYNVTEPKLANNAVSTRTIQNGAVTEPKLDNGAVSTRVIQNGAVTEPKLANDAVSTRVIQNDSITTEKIRDGAITGDKIAEGSISLENIAEGVIPDGFEIPDGSITEPKLDPTLFQKLMTNPHPSGGGGGGDLKFDIQDFEGNNGDITSIFLNRDARFIVFNNLLGRPTNATLATNDNLEQGDVFLLHTKVALNLGSYNNLDPGSNSTLPEHSLAAVMVTNEMPYRYYIVLLSSLS